MKALAYTKTDGGTVALFACTRHSKLILEKWHQLEHAGITHTDVPDDYTRPCCWCPDIVGAR